MIKHNVFLQPCGDKVIVLAVLPKEVFGKPLPNQSYSIATTTKNIYTNMNPSIQLNMDDLIDGETFAAMMGTESPKGMGIAGIITEGAWFAQEINSYLDKLLS